MFRTVPLSSIRSFFFHCTHSNVICHIGLLKASEQDQHGTSLSCVTYTIVVCTVKKLPDDGQKNCPKHVKFYSKNKFQKLVHLVGFIIKLYNDARPPECLTLYTLKPPYVLLSVKSYTLRI